MIINAIEAPLVNTANVGTPFFDTLESIPGSTRCLAIENTALEPPRIEAIVADAV